MRDLLKLLPLVILFILVFIYREPITEYIVEKIIFSKEIYIDEPNQYALDYDFEYIKTTDDFIADNRQEILNIIYTSLNNGYDNFYFYCHYEECQEDVSDITEPENLITISN